MRRVGAEAALAMLFAGGILVAGGAALYFVFTMSVHTVPAEVPSSAAAAPAARFAGAAEEARRLARALVVEENLPGLSVAVAAEDKIAWAEGFGYANVDTRAPITPLTRFRIGVVAKPLTSAAVGILRDRGRLDLEAPVQQYVPSYTAKQWPVNTRQLMGDVAGVHHLENGNERVPARHCESLAEAVRLFANDPLVFRPGTQYRYSVCGWILVSAVIEGAAGEPYPTFMAREVFQPLGMESTVPDADGVPNRVSFYFPRMNLRPDLGLQDAPEADYSCYGGAGAFLSTPSDLVRFGSAMLKPGLLKAETLSLIESPVRLESGRSSDYALGWKVESVQLSGRQVRMLAYRGNPMGGYAALMLFPDLGLAVAALTNVSHATNIGTFGIQVADAFSSKASGGAR